MGAMSRVLLAAVVLAAACSDDPPEIRNLKYQPNAGNVGMMNPITVNAMVDYTDSDDDISQYQWVVKSPSGYTVTSPKTPIDSPNQGPIGSVPITIQFAPDVVGNYTFDVWIIDLKARQSNGLQGLVQVAPATP